MRLHELILISMISLLIFEYAEAGRNKYEADNYNSGKGLQKKKGHEYQKYSESADEDSGEVDIIKYYNKRDKSKKTLGDVFREKKQKKQAKKQRFEKNVLKHFKTDDDEEEEESSEEEIVAPLRKIKLDRCDSAEEECL